MSFIRRGFLLPGGAAKPQECLLPFKVLPRRMATKRPAQGWHNYALKSIYWVAQENRPPVFPLVFILLLIFMISHGILLPKSKSK